MGQAIDELLSVQEDTRYLSTNLYTPIPPDLIDEASAYRVLDRLNLHKLSG
jgi:hypothetical protein